MHTYKVKPQSQVNREERETERMNKLNVYFYFNAHTHHCEVNDNTSHLPRYPRMVNE